MTISSARRRIIEVLERCQIDTRARSLLQKALAESWQVAPVRSHETNSQIGKPSSSVTVRYPSPSQERSP